MINGYVKADMAEILYATDYDDGNDWFAVIAPVRLFKDTFYRVDMLDVNCWAVTDGNVLAVVIGRPTATHPVWSECDCNASYVYEQVLFPYQCYADELGDNGDYAYVADDYFSILMNIVYLYKTLQSDPDTFDWLVK